MSLRIKISKWALLQVNPSPHQPILSIQVAVLFYPLSYHRYFVAPCLKKKALVSFLNAHIPKGGSHRSAWTCAGATVTLNWLPHNIHLCRVVKSTGRGIITLTYLTKSLEVEFVQLHLEESPVMSNRIGKSDRKLQYRDKAHDLLYILIPISVARWNDLGYYN